MGSWRNHHRAATGPVLAGLVIGAVLGVGACGNGDGAPSARPSAGVSLGRPTRGDSTAQTSPPAEPTKTAAQPTRTREPGRTTAPAEPTTKPPTSAAALPPQPTQTTPTRERAETTPPPTTKAPAAAATSPSAATAAAESEGLGPSGWLLLIGLLAAMIIGGLLIYRSQRKSAWDSEARSLESETRTVIGTRLGPVLTATTAAQRGLAWPPVRASLVDLVNRWNGLTARASGDTRTTWSVQISGLLQDLIAAVDGENEALAVGRDWTLLRPRVAQAEQALSAALARRPQTEPPPAAEEPGPPAYQP